jgi:hypothetical protein
MYSQQTEIRGMDKLRMRLPVKVLSCASQTGNADVSGLEIVEVPVIL